MNSTDYSLGIGGGSIVGGAVSYLLTRKAEASANAGADLGDSGAFDAFINNQFIDWMFYTHTTEATIFIVLLSVLISLLIINHSKKGM